MAVRCVVMDSLGKNVHTDAAGQADGRSLAPPFPLRYSPRYPQPSYRRESDMDFVWFFVGIAAVIAGLTYIKLSTPNR